MNIYVSYEHVDCLTDGEGVGGQSSQGIHCCLILRVMRGYHAAISSMNICDAQHQGLSQDLETVCQKLAISTFLGHPIFLGRQQYIHISTIDMHLLIEIRHNILI